jgi:CRP/FNR family transcriptional regulator, cyclic AMP receptor protein
LATDGERFETIGNTLSHENETERESMKDLKPKIVEHPFFRGMKPEHLDVLARHAREAEFEVDQVIFRERDSAYQFYLILEGKVAVESYAPRHDNIRLQVLAAGDALGWSWLFPPFTWNFQARALEPTKAIFLDGASLLVACERNPDLGYELMKRIAQVVIKRLQATRKYRLELHEADDPPFAMDQGAAPAPFNPRGASLKAILAEHPFLQGLKPEHLEVLSRSAMQTGFNADELIFREGDLANRFYLIQGGRIAIESSQPESSAAVIQVIGDGDVLGWSWLFPPYYWHFDARALTPTEAIFLYGTRLREECEQNHELGYELMKRIAQVLIQRLQATRRQLLELLSRANTSAKNERNKIPARACV